MANGREPLKIGDVRGDVAAPSGPNRDRVVDEAPPPIQLALLHWRRVVPGGQGGGMSSRRCRPVSVVPCSAFKGFRFPPEIIVLAVRWYLRYGLSYRDLEELLAERGIEVDHVTVFRWVQRFTPLLADAARPCRHAVGDRWFVDETYVKVAGRWRYVYRAVDQHGQIIDVFVSPRRDTRSHGGSSRPRSALTASRSRS